jgi:hypothetical protein
MADYPPLNKFYTASYSANDRDFPVVAIRLDPRTAGYRVPEDLSPHPDSKRYPNHVFTGAQPASGDQVVTHIYEILPAPYVPFTRYDDDLGPIQGRRRSVKNEGQVARLGPDQRVNYEAREGSAIVYTEIEESWSVATDDDGNSLFPVRDRDFYDASRGAVQERRQLFVPTGEEEGTLENINGVITQTSYEPYNEYLSIKIVQTYKVDGPQLIGKATDEARQLATVTTQRKGSADYVPPNPTAKRTVEVSREDAESLIERIVEVPEVFGAEAYRKTKEDITPQKFKAAQEDVVFEQTIEGTANPAIVLGAGEFVKSEEQVNKFTKRVSTTSRSITSAVTLLEKVLTPQGQIGTRTLRLDVGDQSFIPSATLVDANVEALGDGRTVKTEVTVPNVFEGKSLSLEKPDVTPQKFRANIPSTSVERSIAGTVGSEITLAGSEISKSEQQVTEFVKRVRTEERDPAAEGEVFGETYTTELGGGVAQVTERYGASVDISPAYGTVAAEKEALGDGKFVTREVELASLPELTGQNYDEELDIVFPFTQQFVEPNTGVGEARTEVQPRDVFHSLKRTIDINQFRNAALSQHWAIGDLVNVSLPDRLTSIGIIKTTDRAEGEAEAVGSTGWNVSADSSANITYSVRPTIVNGYSGPVAATRFVFFLDKNNSTITSVISKLTSLYGSTVSLWPALKPEPITITLNGASVRRRRSKSIYVASIGNVDVAGVGNVSGSDDYSTSLQTSIVNIPPTIHSGFNLNVIETYELQNTANAQLPDGFEDLGDYSDSITAPVANAVDDEQITYFPKTISATSPAIFPVGNYVTSIDSQSFRYGLVRFTAVVSHITSNYV